MSIFGEQEAYRHNGDHDLMTSLGLRTSGFGRDWTDLGTVTLDSQREERPDTTIKVEVTAVPAQFFRFTITRPNEDNCENGGMPLEVFEITTGSGSFGEYYEVALLVAGDRLNVKEIQEPC